MHPGAASALNSFQVQHIFAIGHYLYGLFLEAGNTALQVARLCTFSRRAWERLPPITGLNFGNTETLASMVVVPIPWAAEPTVLLLISGHVLGLNLSTSALSELSLLNFFGDGELPSRFIAILWLFATVDEGTRTVYIASELRRNIADDPDNNFAYSVLFHRLDWPDSSFARHRWHLLNFTDDGTPDDDDADDDRELSPAFLAFHGGQLYMGFLEAFSSLSSSQQHRYLLCSRSSSNVISPGSNCNRAAPSLALKMVVSDGIDVAFLGFIPVHF